MVLDATIHLAGPEGVRSMSIADFYALDGMTRNVLNTGEFVTHVSTPEESDDLEGDYQKLSLRESWDFPEAGVAAAWKRTDTGLSTLRIATTACESIPRIHPEQAKAALVDWNGESTTIEVAEAIRKEVKPVNNTYFPPAYRRKMLRVLTKRALKGTWM